MTDDHDLSSDRACKRGLSKLMLKLPAVRSQLRQATGEPLQSLAEAYEDATSTLESLRRARNPDNSLSDEYDRLCQDIEAEVLRYCHRRS
jgi:hypothetical protein